MSAYRVYAAPLHKDYAVGVLHAGHALGYDYLGGFRYKFAEALAYKRVGTGIHSARGIIQNKYLGLFQQSAGYTQALLLSARNVGAALLNPGIVFLGELLDKFVRLGKTAGLLHCPSADYP